VKRSETIITCIISNSYTITKFNNLFIFFILIIINIIIMTDDDKIKDYLFYKITCLDASKNLLYIGQTTNIKRRKTEHKGGCNNIKNEKYYTKVYRIIRANGGWSNFRMDAFDKKEQITRIEAEKIEEKFIIDLKANMNSNYICNITEEQRRKYREEEITCICGRVIKNCDLKLHHKSNEHINKMKIINTPKSFTDRTLDLYVESLFENNTNDSNVIRLIIPDIKNMILD